jgi:hypothetical protein
MGCPVALSHNEDEWALLASRGCHDGREPENVHYYNNRRSSSALNCCHVYCTRPKVAAPSSLHIWPSFWHDEAQSSEPRRFSVDACAPEVDEAVSIARRVKKWLQLLLGSRSADPCPSPLAFLSTQEMQMLDRKCISILPCSRQGSAEFASRVLRACMTRRC